MEIIKRLLEQKEDFYLNDEDYEEEEDVESDENYTFYNKK